MNFHMETLTTAQAAERLGVNVQKFHRLAAKHGVAPALAGTGIRGPKFWHPRDVEWIARLEQTTGTAA